MGAEAIVQPVKQEFALHAASWAGSLATHIVPSALSGINPECRIRPVSTAGVAHKENKKAIKDYAFPT